MPEAVQDLYAPSSICFGCGPANAQGLRIKSRWEGDDFVATWRPEPHHQAFPGVLNGGIVGALLDCHSNWCAATALMRERSGRATESQQGRSGTSEAGREHARSERGTSEDGAGERSEDRPPVTVTAEFHVKLRRPAPAEGEVVLRARPVTVEGDKVTVEAELVAGGKVCATCRGVFVAVKEGHPAYHRWS